MGATLKNKVGGLPVWAWFLIFVLLLGGYLVYRKKHAMNQAQAAAQNQSSTGTVPVSNLSTDAEPMPIQAGDTFVNVTDNDPTKAPPLPRKPPVRKMMPLTAARKAAQTLKPAAKKGTPTPNVKPVAA